MSGNKKNVMVIGAAGLVGNSLVRAWERRGARVVGTNYPEGAAPSFLFLDIRDEEAIRRTIAEAGPCVVALPAANPHVDFCEQHPKETRAVNVAGSLNVVRVCGERDIPMIFFSSDYVFDGSQGEYGEDDPPSPLNEYGRQKSEVEAAVMGASPRNLVIRTAGAFGWQWEPKNFVLQVLSRLGRGEPMKVAEDLSYNPTYAENLAEIVCELADCAAEGLFNVVGSDRVRRLDFARQAAEAFGLDDSLLEPVSSRGFKAPAARPKDSSLRTDKVRGAVSTPLWGPERSLEDMVSVFGDWARYAAARLPKTVDFSRLLGKSRRI